MVTFVAKDKIKGNSFDKIDAIVDGIEKGNVSDTSKTGFTATSGKVEAEVGGTGFHYIGIFGTKIPDAGTIETVDIFFKNDLLFKVSGMSLTVAQASTFNNVDEALETIFMGDDLIKGSKENDKLRGFDGDDTIKGRAGKDKLQGDKGADILNGGKDKDTYFFKDGPGNGVDTVSNLQSGEKMKFDHNAFAGIGSKGALDPDLFVENGAFTNTSQRFSYDTSTKTLSFDADGSGAGAAQAVVHIAKGDFDVGHLFVV